jgi:hypothetical protein
MSQDIRRRIATRRHLFPTSLEEDDVPAPLRIRRFSEGLEHPALEGDRLHLGRFSEGTERLPDDAPSKAHIGSFADGLRHGPEDAFDHLHVGRFSEGLDHSPV